MVEYLEPGCVVLFYTDGLVERRGASLEDGMAAVARAAAGPTDVESLCECVSQAMNAEDASDDVALLALSLTPTPDRDRSHPAEAAASGTTTRAEAVAGNIAVVVLKGDIDLATVDEAKQTLIEAAISGATGVVIDLSGVTSLDSCAVNVLFLMARRLEQRGQSAAVVVPPGSLLRKVFSLTALDRLLPFFSDPDEAMAALRKKARS